MAGIRINKFAGEMPRVAPRQLPPEAAQVATNCNLNTGSLKGFKKPGLTIGTPWLTSALVYESVAKINNNFTLLMVGDVDVVRSHAYDADDRFFYSDGSSKLKQSNYTLASDGVPRLTKGTPSLSYYLGVPKPATALTAAVSGSPGYSIEKSVSYVYTYVAEFGSTLREGKPSDPSNTIDVYEDQYVSLTGLVTPVPTGYNIVGYRIYRLETGTSGSNYELLDTLLDSGEQYTSYATPILDKVTSSFTAGTGTITAVGTKVTGAGSAFLSQLSAGKFIIPTGVGTQARKVVTVLSDTELTIDFDFSPAVSGAAFTFGTGYTLIQDTAEIISTEDYDEPVAGMSGLIELSNGCYAAFIKNKIYISEPFIPDAWPYSIELNDDVVALGYYGTTIIAATQTNPYKIEVYDPQAITKQLLPIKQACLFKRSMVSGDRFCIYASPDGLVYIGEDGYKVLTDKVLTKEQWFYSFTNPGYEISAPYSKTIFSFYHDNKYIAFYENESTGFLFDFNDAALQSIVKFDISVGGSKVSFCGGYINEEADALRLLVKYPKTGTAAYFMTTWDSSSVKDVLQYTWRSKVFSYPTEVSFERCAVNADFSTIGVTCKIYCDGAVIHGLGQGHNPIKNNDPFPLSYACGKEWEIQIEGTREVFEVVMATSIGDLVALYQG